MLWKIETKDEELSAKEIYKKCAKSVVGIIVNQNSRSFFGDQIQTQGSGVIIRSDGYILTNAHVIGECYKQNSDISVILDDETPISANLISSLASISRLVWTDGNWKASRWGGKEITKR